MDPQDDAATGNGQGASPLVAWGAVAILSAFYILSSVDRSMFGLASPAVQKSLHLTDVQLSLLQGVAFSIFFGVAGLPLGWAADRFSRRWIIFLGVIVWSLSTAGTGLAGSFLTLFAPRAGVGAGEASLSPCAQSLLGDLFPRRRLGFAASVYGISANVGGGLGTTMGGMLLAALTVAGGLSLPLVGHLQPWQAACVIIGLPGVLLAGLAFAIHEPHRRSLAAGPQEGSTWGDFLAFIGTEPWLVARHFLSFPMAALAIYTAGAWMPIFLTRVHHMPIAEIGAILGLTSGLFGIVGNLAVGVLSDWMTRRGMDDAYYRIGIYTSLIAAPCGVATFLAGAPGLTVAMYSLFYLTAPSFSGTATASLNVITPERLRGKIFSCYWLWMALMGAAGPLIAANLTQHLFHDPLKVGWSAATVVGVSLPIAALMFALNLKGLRRVVRERSGSAVPA